jgi:pantothenate kinase-related protein Tda10
MRLVETPRIVVKVSGPISDARIESLAELIEPELDKLYAYMEQVEENIRQTLTKDLSDTDITFQVVEE